MRRLVGEVMPVPVTTSATDESQDYEIVQKGALMHPGDQTRSDNGIWFHQNSIKWGLRATGPTRRRRVQDYDLPSLLLKAKKLAKSLTDPVQRERRVIPSARGR